MLSFFIFRALVLVRRGVFFAVGEGLSIYLPASRFSFTPFDGLPLFFFVSTLPSGYYASDSGS